MNSLNIKFPRTEHLHVIKSITDEYNKAIEKHPKFANGFYEACIILNEEVGEVNKAILDYVHNDDIENMDHFKTEVAQTAAVCIRILEMIYESC